MKANGTCCKCGSECFEIFSTQECGNSECANFSPEFACPESPAPILSKIDSMIKPCGYKFYIPFGDWITNAGHDWRKTLPDLAKDPDVYEGEPKATPQCSVDQLKSWGTVGLYRRKK